MRKREIILNSVFLKNRIQELGIKQWWLAEQIGVDRKTITRWIQGKVMSIQSSTLDNLANILECVPSDLTLQDIADHLATPEDQRMAAQLLTSSALMDRLGPIGEWDVIESLLRATIVPNLPLFILGELYDQLSIASWRQNKIEQAATYNSKAEKIGNQINDTTLLASSLLTKANIYSWRGDIRSSIETYRTALNYGQYLEGRLLGAIHSNLGAVLYESGDLSEGEYFINSAIEIFQSEGKPTNLSIAYCHLAMIELKKRELSKCKHFNDMSIGFACHDEYKRGFHMSKLIAAEVAALSGEIDQAVEFMSEAFQGFASLNIEEGLNFQFAGRIYRLIGDFKSSVSHLQRGIDLTNSFPMERAELFFELAKTLFAMKVSQEEVQTPATHALNLYIQCGAPIKIQELNRFIGEIKNN